MTWASGVQAGLKKKNQHTRDVGDMTASDSEKNPGDSVRGRRDSDIDRAISASVSASKHNHAITLYSSHLMLCTPHPKKKISPSPIHHETMTDRQASRQATD